MANEVTTTTANDLTYAASILAEDIIAAKYHNNGVLRFTRQSSLAGFPSKAKDFPLPPVIAAASLTEGTDAANTAFATGKDTITASEVGLMLTVTDVLSVSDIVENSFYAMEAGKALAAKITTDICAQSANLNQTAVGTSGSNLTEANILDGIATLEGASVPGPYGMILHPQQRRDLIDDIGTTAISNLSTVDNAVNVSAYAGTAYAAVGDGDKAVAANPDGNIGSLYGMTAYTTAAVPTANAGADRGGMIVSVNRAVGFVEKWAARVELERDASLRAVEIVVTSDYGTGVLDGGNSGVAVVTDA